MRDKSEITQKDVCKTVVLQSERCVCKCALWHRQRRPVEGTGFSLLTNRRTDPRDPCTQCSKKQFQAVCQLKRFFEIDR